MSDSESNLVIDRSDS